MANITYIPPKNNKAKNIKIEDIDNNFQSNNVEGALKELAESGGSGSGHTHINKPILDTITQEKIDSWDDVTNKIDKTKINDDGTGTDELWSASKLNMEFNTIAKDLIIENDKLYLKQLDGTKIGSGVNLPINNSSGGKVWTLVKSIITTEEVSSIEISTDSNGNTFLLSDFVIYIKSLSSTSFPSKGSIRLTYKNNFNSYNITYVGLSNIFNSPTHCIIEQYKDYNIQSIPKLFKKTILGDTNTYEKSLCLISNINNVKIESITSGITFPIGTILEVWK